MTWNMSFPPYCFLSDFSCFAQKLLSHLNKQLQQEMSILTDGHSSIKRAMNPL